MPDGVAIHARDYAGGATRAPVVCLHGLTRNARDFDAVAPDLAATGRRVIVPTMRGRGQSDRDADWRRYCGEVYADDVLRVLDHFGVRDAVFIGTSMGGIITMLLASVAPARIVATILNDIGPALNPAGIARIMGYVGKDATFASWQALAAALQSVQSSQFPGTGEDFWLSLAQATGRAREDGRIVFDYDPAIVRALMEPSAPPPDLMPMFAELAKKPVLLVHGALSDLLTNDGIRAMRAVKPDLEIVHVPQTGHAPRLTEHVAREAILRFLDRVP